MQSYYFPVETPVYISPCHDLVLVPFRITLFFSLGYFSYFIPICNSIYSLCIHMYIQLSMYIYIRKYIYIYINIHLQIYAIYLHTIFIYINTYDIYIYYMYTMHIYIYIYVLLIYYMTYIFYYIHDFHSSHSARALAFVTKSAMLFKTWCCMPHFHALHLPSFVSSWLS